MKNWFEEFENRPIVGKDQIPWKLTTEYEIQSEYLVSNLKSLPKLDTARDSVLLATAQHCNNLICFIEQMQIMGFTGFPEVIEGLFDHEFGNRQKLAELRQSYTEKWLHGKRGQYKVNQNHFTVHQNKLYYCNIRNEWYEVEPASIFDIMPKLKDPADSATRELLNHDYKSTKYQKIYSKWRDDSYAGNIPQFRSKTGQTTPEEILEDTFNSIKTIIESPISFKEIERVTQDRPDYLEYLIKVSCLIADFAQERRALNEHSLYLLRDCAMFHEAQIVLDLLEGKQTSHEQIYLGRQSLSSKQRDAGHWYVCQELLLLSLQKHPDDFDNFYSDFAQKLKDYEEYSHEFAELIQELAKYLRNHIKEAEQKNLAINVIDLGFQGSINMIVKYVLDQYCPELAHPSKIHMYVVAEWFKGVYKDMYSSNTFSALTNIEVMARNNSLYEYVPRSLHDGSLLVTFGNGADQRQADIELVVMAMTIMLQRQMSI